MNAPGRRCVDVERHGIPLECADLGVVCDERYGPVRERTRGLDPAGQHKDQFVSSAGLADNGDHASR